MEWRTALALSACPGLPATESGVIRRAAAEGWTSRPRSGRGGGREYHISSLPQETQDYLLRVSLIPAAPETPSNAPSQGALRPAGSSSSPVVALSSSVPAPARRMGELEAGLVDCSVVLSDWQRRVRDARLLLLLAVDDLALEVGERRAVVEMVGRIRSGQIPEGCDLAKVRLRDQQIDQATLYRWRRALAKGGADALAPRSYRKVRRPEWMSGLMEAYQNLGKPSVSGAMRRYAETNPGLPVPSLRSAQYHIASLPKEVREWGRMGRRQMRSVQPFVRRTTDGLWPMDVVTVDGHSFKAYVQHPASGRRIRPEVTTYLDIATRKVVGAAAWVSESQYAIWLALREMVLAPAHGIAAIQYSDNDAYRGAEHRAVLDRLGTTPMYAQAYRAQARGAIERLNASLWIPLARTFPTYCGDDVDSELFKRALRRADEQGEGVPTWDEFMLAVARAVDAYNATPHSQLRSGRERLSPNQAWARAVADGWTPTLLEGDDLHELLPAVTRTVARGEVSLPWGRYYSDELRYVHEREVRVAYDPARGERVWVSDMAGRLLCIAQRDGNARSYVPESQMEHARQKRQAGRVARLEKRIAAVRADELPVIEGEVLDLPFITLSRDALEPVADIATAARALAEADMARQQHPLDALGTDPERYQAWKQIRARQQAGQPLDERETGFLASFGEASYCRLMVELEDEYERALARG